MVRDTAVCVVEDDQPVWDGAATAQLEELGAVREYQMHSYLNQPGTGAPLVETYNEKKYFLLSTHHVHDGSIFSFVSLGIL